MQTGSNGATSVVGLPVQNAMDPRASDLDRTASGRRAVEASEGTAQPNSRSIRSAEPKARTDASSDTPSLQGQPAPTQRSAHGLPPKVRANSLLSTLKFI
ncbi:hypothetical protein SEVIR_9G341601v4 [Setaria viridis]